MSRRAVFLDRDGTIMEEVGFCADPAHVRLFPGSREALRDLKREGYLLIIVTNQSGIGRGYFTEEAFHHVQHELFRQLGEEAAIDATYFCGDHPDTFPSRRKPAPDMLLEAARDWEIDLRQSFLVGDRKGDIEAGKAAGCKTILVLTGYGAEDPNNLSYGADVIAPDLKNAAWNILNTFDREEMEREASIEQLRREYKIRRNA